MPAPSGAGVFGFAFFPLALECQIIKQAQMVKPARLAAYAGIYFI